MKRLLFVVTVLAMVSSLSALAFAADANWTGGAGTDLWVTDGNWSAAHPGTGNTATFNAAAGGGGAVIDLSGPEAVKSIFFNTANCAAYTIGHAADVLTVDATGAIWMDGTVVNTQTIATAVVLAGDYSFYNNSTDNTKLLNFTDDITGPAVAGTLTLKGTNTGNNTISTGVIKDGAAALAVTKIEAGTWKLSGANTYTGVTTVTAGTLIAETNAAALGAGTLTMNGGKLQLGSGADTNFGRNTTVTADSEIDSDRLAAAAGVNLTLGTLSIGTNTLTVGIAALANAGTQGLIFGAVTLTGNATINAVAGAGAAGKLLTLGAVGGATRNLTIGGTANTTIGGIIGTTTGTLTKNDAGTLTLSGVNTYTGATTINAGTLALDATGRIATSSGVENNGTFTITGAAKTIDSLTGAGATTLGNILTIGDGSNTSCTYSGVASGAGGITKDGTGTLTLSGTNTYTGDTTITAGTLRVSNASALGTAITADVAHNGATLDIGSTALAIGGTYIQNGAATLMVAVNGTTHGSIVAGGNATVTATDNLVLTISNYIPNNATYTIIDGAGGAGVAAPIITTPGYNNALFTATTVGEDLVLTATRGAANGFAADATAGDSNASGVGTVLDTITSTTTDMATVLNTMDGLSNAQVASSLDTLVPEVDAGVLNTSTTALNNFVGVAMDRVEQTLKVAKAADSAATGVSAGEASKLSGAWGKGYGSYLTQGTRNGIAGYDAWNAGTALGVDHLFADCVTLGVSGGYAYGNVDSDVNNANTYINSAQTTIYGGYEDKNLPFFIDAAGSFAWNWYQGQRDINIGGAILRTANASYDGQQYGAYIGGGYRFDVTKNIEFTPLLSLQYNHLQLKSYTETEAGALNLSVASQGYDQLQSGLGARIAAPMKYKWGTLTPEAHGKWFYDFIGDNMVVSSNFNGGGASFNSSGAKPALNSFNAGGELTFDFKNNISLVASCDTEMKDEFFGIYGSATVRYEF